MLRLHPKSILPLMIFVGVLIVGVRAGDVVSAITSDKPFASVQRAEAAAEKPADKAAETTGEKKADTPAATKPEAGKAEVKKGDEKFEKSSAVTAAKESTSPESDLYKQLQGRREQLEKRSSELDEREALAVVTEKRIDQKIKEMEVIRTQVQALLGQASAAQQAQLENLVKIYEIMKPKEAAKIFETLEMPVLLGVVQKMKPARTAAVLAEMNPEKAKEITVALTRQDQLPQVK